MPLPVLLFKSYSSTHQGYRILAACRLHWHHWYPSYHDTQCPRCHWHRPQHALESCCYYLAVWYLHPGTLLKGIKVVLTNVHVCIMHCLLNNQRISFWEKNVTVYCPDQSFIFSNYGGFFEFILQLSMESPCTIGSEIPDYHNYVY